MENDPIIIFTHVSFRIFQNIISNYATPKPISGYNINIRIKQKMQKY